MADIEDVLEQRGKTHGDFSDVAYFAQRMRELFRQRGVLVSDSQAESLDMIAGKLARILVGNPNEPDHWLDIEGYARLARERIKTDG
tara:strand:+ start:1005 stop:1265 length:261 start_codon:yes stop_codon:yes gene_type:complete